MGESPRERVRQLLLNQRTAQPNSPKGLGRVFDWLFGSLPQATYFFEHSDCNPERSHCTGEVQRTWLVAKEGIREVAIAPHSISQERRGMWYRYRRVHFYIAPDGEWIVKTSIDGPRAGGGGCSRVVAKGKTLDLVAEGASWKS
jgi:hypothetical protein